MPPFPFPILETERLILREWQDIDAEAMFKLFGSEEVIRYTPVERHTSPERSLQTILRFRARFYEKHEGIVWAIERKDTAEAIGEAGIYEWSPEHFRLSIGYSLNPENWSYGYATEATERIVRYAFEDFPTFKVNRIEATTDPANAASIKVLKKIGFQQEAYLREYEMEKERFVNSIMFSLLRSEFTRPNSSRTLHSFR